MISCCCRQRQKSDTLPRRLSNQDFSQYKRMANKSASSFAEKNSRKYNPHQGNMQRLNILCCIVLFLFAFTHYGYGVSLSPTSTTSRPSLAISSRLLYPVDEVTDRLNISNLNAESVLPPLPFKLPLFEVGILGNSRPKISRHGYLTFVSKGARQNESSQDTPFIGVLVAPQNLSSVPGSGVYARILRIGDNSDLWPRIARDFNQGMVGPEFYPKYVIIVTWKNTTLLPDHSSNPTTNTYQLVLATDELRTYAMLNYDRLKNVTGAQGKDIFVGFWGLYPQKKYSYPTYSQSNRISALATSGYGNGLRGRHYFRVDTDPAETGSCLDKRYDVSNTTRHLRLTFYPREGNMLGGTIINVTGPCFQPGSRILCHFGKLATVVGTYLDSNRASCVAPFLSYHGFIDFSVGIGNNDTYFAGKYYVHAPDLADADVTIEGQTIRWNADKLSSQRNATSARISLWGVTKKRGNFTLAYIDEITSQPVHKRKGFYEIEKSEIEKRWNPATQNLTFGFLSVNVSGARGQIWSRPMPLDWYFKPQWEKIHGSGWSREMCSTWLNKERYAPRINVTLPPCPCTLIQAEKDIAHFKLHEECNILDRKCRPRYAGSVACFRSATPNSLGYSQTCCYDSYGELLRAADFKHAGRVARASPYGKYPFKASNHVPSLSHWELDIMPYFFCCGWQENEDQCRMFDLLRPTQDCAKPQYKTPTVGSVFGDPHFRTFNGLPYTFNGRGEFVLTRVNTTKRQVDIQGRFERVPPTNTRSPVNATILAAVAARSNKSSVIEFRLRHPNASWRYPMDVIVDKEYVDLPSHSNVLYFPGLTVYQPIGIVNRSIVIATFENGVGLQVTATYKQLAVNVFISQDYKNQTRGLLGNYNKDDFVLPDGEVALPPTANAKRIHEFGKKWRLTERYQKNVGASLFYHDVLSWRDYDEENFTATFVDPEESQSEAIRLLCVDEFPCTYDYVVTGDKRLAETTKAQDLLAYIYFQRSRDVTIRCPSLPNPLNGRKSNDRYFPGTVVEFICEPGYILRGQAIHKCKDTGKWDSATPPTCVKDEVAATTRRMVPLSATTASVSNQK